MRLRVLPATVAVHSHWFPVPYCPLSGRVTTFSARAADFKWHRVQLQNRDSDFARGAPSAADRAVPRTGARAPQSDRELPIVAVDRRGGQQRPSHGHGRGCHWQWRAGVGSVEQGAAIAAAARSQSPPM